MKFKVITLFTVILFVLASTLTISVSTAASKSPTPTPKASITKKAPVKKAPVKKKAAVKKKIDKITPPPSPKWPPTGFKTDALGVTKLYMKVPTAKELGVITAANKALSAQIKDCIKFTCGAVLIASEIGCRWWQVTGDVVGATSIENRTLKTFGKVTASVAASAPLKILTVLLVTTEPRGSGQIVSNISADCNQGEPTGPIPLTEYKVAG